MNDTTAKESVRAGWVTPLLHVASVERSIAFWERLGFELVDTDRCEPIGFARLHCEGGAIGLLRGEPGGPPFDPKAQAVLFALYTPDLPALRERLLAEGVEVAEIRRPPYMPSGEMRVVDPDGYGVLVNHWGPAEHAAWLERIGKAPGGQGRRA